MNRPVEQPGGAGTPISPLMVPLLLLGLMIGFFAGYFHVWWGLLVVGAVLLAAVSMVFSGRSRDGATGAVVGVLLGYAGVLLLAFFRGVI